MHAEKANYLGFALIALTHGHPPLAADVPVFHSAVIFNFKFSREPLKMTILNSDINLSTLVSFTVYAICIPSIHSWNSVYA
jgi:hypothetical protein